MGGSRDRGDPDVGAAEAGPLSRIIAELAAAPADDAVAAWREALRPGDRLDRFEIRRAIGQGGFGAVYEAWDPELGRAVAVKTLRPGRSRGELGASWIRREAEAIARLSDPGIVTIHDVCNCAQGPYLVLELLEGRTLAERLREGPMARAQAVRVAEAIARALAHAHRRGVLHRDLKPGNVFLCHDGTVKLLDFGLAHLLGSPDAGGGGTPAYMAPEQARGGPVDARADVYAAGRVLAEMLGERPPPRLARAVEAATAADPARRPADGAAWRAMLESAERAALRTRRAWQVALLVAGVLLLGAAAAGVATWRERAARELADADGRVTIAVADLENGTRDPDLDGLSGLLTTSLDQSRRLRVLTRGRLLELLPGGRREGRVVLDEGVARDLAGRAGARAILVGSIRSFGDVYAGELRAVDPRSNAYLFTVKARVSGKEHVPDLVDRLSEEVRRELRESRQEIQRDSVKVAEAVTPSLEAYREYFRGLECLDGATFVHAACVAHLEAAVAADPSFAIAWLDLAYARYWTMARGAPEAAREALRHVDHAPPRERLAIRAVAAQIEGREDDAVRWFPEAAAAAPNDRHVQLQAADFFASRNELQRALPYARRAADLDPSGRTSARAFLAAWLGALGRREDLSALRREVEALAPGTDRTATLATIDGWLGDRDRAVAGLKEVRRNPDRAAWGGAPWIDVSRAVLGDPTVEGDVRAGLADDPGFWIPLSMIQALRGQRREARASLGRMPDEALRPHYLAEFLVGDGDAEAVWREAHRAATRAPRSAPNLAVHLAYMGALDHAAVLAHGLEPGAPRHRLYEAVVAWRRGDRTGALEELRRLTAENPWSTDVPVLPPSFLLGELAVEAGEDATAVEALQRFQSLQSHNPYWGWAYPRSVLLLATAESRLGRRDEARRRLAAQLDLWRDADAGLPLLAEMKELCRRLDCRAGSPPP
jgi:tetratricopeptide (TPR) repeat protein